MEIVFYTGTDIYLFDGDPRVRIRRLLVRFTIRICQLLHAQGRSQEFDLGGYKWVKETKQPHKNI